MFKASGILPPNNRESNGKNMENGWLIENAGMGFYGPVGAMIVGHLSVSGFMVQRDYCRDPFPVSSVSGWGSQGLVQCNPLP